MPKVNSNYMADVDQRANCSISKCMKKSKKDQNAYSTRIGATHPSDVPGLACEAHGGLCTVLYASLCSRRLSGLMSSRRRNTSVESLS